MVPIPSTVLPSGATSVSSQEFPQVRRGMRGKRRKMGWEFDFRRKLLSFQWFGGFSRTLGNTIGKFVTPLPDRKSQFLSVMRRSLRRAAGI